MSITRESLHLGEGAVDDAGEHRGRLRPDDRVAGNYERRRAGNAKRARLQSVDHYGGVKLVAEHFPLETLQVLNPDLLRKTTQFRSIEFMVPVFGGGQVDGVVELPEAALRRGGTSGAC